MPPVPAYRALAVFLFHDDLRRSSIQQVYQYSIKQVCQFQFKVTVMLFC